jgi:predicted Zn-dependent peptidase
MNTNKTFKRVTKGGKKFNLLTFPNSNFFKFEITNLYGSNIERVIESKTGKNLYGISHFVEHLAFKSPKDFTTKELMDIAKNEGTYNASTNQDRINYWFQTTMDNLDLGIKFVCNVAQNDFMKVNEEEFNTEKNVVYNEAKKAWDNHQVMFYRNARTKMLGYHQEDNNIGVPETISKFTLEDAIAVKNIFLNNNQNIYNITYDNTLISEDEVIEKIEKELARFKVGSKPIFDISDEEYRAKLKYPANQEFKLESEAKQAMTSIVIDGIDHTIVGDASLFYLARLAPDTSLNELIREKNGLTYHIYFYQTLISYKPYINFACDVTVGNESKLIELFKESINLSADNFNKEKYERYMKSMKLKRTMANLNMVAHNIWFRYDYRASSELDEFRDILSNNIDEGYEYIDNNIVTYEAMNESIQKIRALVNSGAFAKVSTH